MSLDVIALVVSGLAIFIALFTDLLKNKFRWLSSKNEQMQIYKTFTEYYSGLELRSFLTEAETLMKETIWINGFLYPQDNPYYKAHFRIASLISESLRLICDLDRFIKRHGLKDVFYKRIFERDIARVIGCIRIYERLHKNPGYFEKLQKESLIISDNFDIELVERMYSEKASGNKEYSNTMERYITDTSEKILEAHKRFEQEQKKHEKQKDSKTS